MPARRDLLLGAAATIGGLSLAAAGSRPVDAAAPLGGGQAPGFYRFKLGEVDVTLINDGQLQRPLQDGFVKNATLVDVQDALVAAFQPRETITIPITTTVINTGQQLVLIDAGTGGLLAPTAAAWLDNFKAAGYAPEQVDLVLVSHFHGDHIQGLRDKDGKARFPNAAIAVPEAEWAFWMDEGQISRAPEAMRQAFQGVHRVFDPVAKDVQQFSGGAELAPGVAPVAAPGHTPGHNAFVVTSGNDRLLIWSDTTNKPELFVRHPEWQAVFDMDGDQAAATRRRLLDMAASDRLPVAGYHFPFPATGFIDRGSDGFQFVPRFWQPA